MPYGWEYQDQILEGADPRDDDERDDEPAVHPMLQDPNLTVGQLLHRVYVGHANGWFRGSAGQSTELLWEMVATDFLYQYNERAKGVGHAAD